MIRSQKRPHVFISHQLLLLPNLNGFLKLILANNTGGFLGWGSQLPESIRFILFSTFVGIALFACLLYIFFSNRLSNQMLIGYSLIIAGGAGNLIDRLIFLGRVTDFIFLSLGPLSTGIFNVADVVFIVGTGLFLFQRFRSPNQSSGG